MIATKQGTVSKLRINIGYVLDLSNDIRRHCRKDTSTTSREVIRKQDVRRDFSWWRRYRDNRYRTWWQRKSVQRNKKFVYHEIKYQKQDKNYFHLKNLVFKYLSVPFLNVKRSLVVVDAADLKSDSWGVWATPVGLFDSSLIFLEDRRRKPSWICALSENLSCEMT